MELIIGGNIFEWLKENRIGDTVTEKKGRILFHKIVKGLQYIHSKGIVHRDIKLDNIMVTIDPLSKEPIPKFIDFGLSAILLQNEKCADVVGSIAFMSPELVLSQPYD